MIAFSGRTARSGRLRWNLNWRGGGARNNLELAETKGDLRPSNSRGQLESWLPARVNGFTDTQRALNVLYSESLCQRTILQFQVPTAEQFSFLSLPGDELREIRLGS